MILTPSDINKIKNEVIKALDKEFVLIKRSNSNKSIHQKHALFVCEMLLEFISEEFKIETEILKQKRHTNKEVSKARMIYCYLARKHFTPHASLLTVGGPINRSHCMVVYFVSTVSGYMDVDLAYKKEIESLIEKFYFILNGKEAAKPKITKQ